MAFLLAVPLPLSATVAAVFSLLEDDDEKEVVAIRAGPRDKDELDDVVEEQESFLITPWKVVGEDSALGLVAGGEQGSTTISGKVKVSFCLRLWEPLLGLQLKGEFGAEDKSLSCFLNDNTVLSDSVDDWTSRFICGTASVLGDLSSSSSSSSMMSSALSTAES